MENEYDNPMVQEEEAAPSPTNLAEAFAALRKSDDKGAQENLEEPGNLGGAGQVGDGGDVAADAQAAREDLGGSPDVPDGGGAELGGSVADDDTLTSFDPNPARQELIKNIQQEAHAQVQKMFLDAGVRLMDISDLYERDDGSGRVTFRNPDDPGRPFNSRFEAQQWVDSMNKQVNARFRQEVSKRQQEIAQNMRPTFEIIEFAPQWQQMPDIEKDVFDTIIEPYAIKDRSGRTIGYQCNLQAAARQASILCQKFNKVQQPGMQQVQQQVQPQKQQRQVKPAAMPAMDAPSGAGDAGADDEPKTLEEAMMKLRRSRK